MIESIDLTRDQVFIANILKCRPPDNRTPAPDEIANCLPYLMRQLEILRPKILCALGGVAPRCAVLNAALQGLRVSGRTGQIGEKGS